jgi:hypothetical protein
VLVALVAGAMAMTATYVLVRRRRGSAAGSNGDDPERLPSEPDPGDAPAVAAAVS